MCEGDKVWMWDAVVCWLKNFFFGVGFANVFYRMGVVCYFFNGFGGIMWCVGGSVREGRCSGEDASCIDTGELSGFSDRVENLCLSEAVDGEVVYGFVGNGPLGVFF